MRSTSSLIIGIFQDFYPVGKLYYWDGFNIGIREGVEYKSLLSLSHLFLKITFQSEFRQITS